MKKLKLILISFFLILLNTSLSFPSDHNYSVISGKPEITDGDTIKINNKKIRFSGIDAPESFFFGKRQVCVLNNEDILCGKLSKDILAEKIGNNIVDCKIEKNKDRYKRLIGECFVKNESLSVFMVKNGYAFDYPKYSKGKFSKYEFYAKNLSLGLWKMTFEYPWIWRKKNR
tara:strand:+ start:1037 stop:1552 length:516 start_codon:yes stop_codon:yes gene_type:complete